MEVLNWGTSEPQEREMIREIVSRVRAHWDSDWGVLPPFQDDFMAMLACHFNGCPLDLPTILANTEPEITWDVFHDFFGIRHHIDRKTGKLPVTFFPRFARSAV